jgi:hypothetical protein
MLACQPLEEIVAVSAPGVSNSDAKLLALKLETYGLENPGQPKDLSPDVIESHDRRIEDVWTALFDEVELWQRMLEECRATTHAPGVRTVVMDATAKQPKDFLWVGMSGWPRMEGRGQTGWTAIAAARNTTAAVAVPGKGPQNSRVAACMERPMVQPRYNWRTQNRSHASRRKQMEELKWADSGLVGIAHRHSAQRPNDTEKAIVLNHRKTIALETHEASAMEVAEGAVVGIQEDGKATRMRAMRWLVAVDVEDTRIQFEEAIAATEQGQHWRCQWHRCS